MKCPVCSKVVLADDIELHLVICLTKPRISYNGKLRSEKKNTLNFSCRIYRKLTVVVYEHSSKLINSTQPFALGPVKMLFQRESYVICALMFRGFAVKVQGSIHEIDDTFFTAVLLLLLIFFFGLKKNEIHGFFFSEERTQSYVSILLRRQC